MAMPKGHGDYGTEFPTSPNLSKTHKYNLIICGEIELNNPSVVPFAIEIKDPSKTTVSDLKAMTSNIIPAIPKNEIVFHFSDSILPDDTPLSQWKEMRSGAAVLATIKPLIVTLQRYNSDIDVKFEIPRQSVDKWSTKSLFDFCLYTGGLPYRNNGNYVFAVEGTIMKEEGKKMSDYADWFERSGDVTISVTYIQAVTKIASKLGSFHVPYSPNLHSAMNYKLSKRILSDSRETASNQQIWGEQDQRKPQSNNEFHHPWNLKVKNLDGTTQTIPVPHYYLTPVYDLKQQISPDTNIRLTFGTTVLEDWDDEGNMMLLCSYPDLHDGATLCQINLTGAIRINYQVVEVSWHSVLNPQYEHLQVNGYALAEKLPSYRSCPNYSCIHIENPKCFTFMKLLKVIKNLNRCYKRSISDKMQCSGKPLQAKPDDFITSINLICDDCKIIGQTRQE